jgi:hypothetical protein
MALATLGGVLLTVLALLLFYQAGGLAAVARPVVLNGSDLQLASGQGEQTPAGLEIRQPGPQGLAVAQGSARLVRAALYRRLSWQVDGLEPGRELRLIWSTLAEPRTVRELALPPAGLDGGTLTLGSEPHWQGRIGAIGLAVSGPLPQPLLVRRLELRPAALSVGDLLRWAVGEWTVFEDWSQRSINYTAGAPLDALFPPVVVVALWVGFSAALYASFGRSHHPWGAWWPYGGLFLLGWLILDVRWQWELSRRLERTVERFAGKEGDERLLAAPDGALYRFLLEIRRRLPNKPVRLFIISADPHDGTAYLAGRTRYHLLPHNGYAGLSQPPAVGVAREGDYVLILSPLTGVRYNRAFQTLEWKNGRLSAELLHEASSGALFRVKGG